MRWITIGIMSGLAIGGGLKIVFKRTITIELH